jgi:hypothetical protein
VSRTPSNFRQQDVARAIRAAKGAGLDVIRIEVDPRSSKITVVVKEDGTTEKKINPFDTAPTPWSAQKRKKKCASE